MILATIESVQEINGQYGPEKVSAITCDDGQQTKVYTKPKAQAIYANLLPGIRVELTPKASGVGYLIKRIVPEDEATVPVKNGYAKPAQPKEPARQSATPTAAEVAAFIENKAGQVAHAYLSLVRHFSAAGIEFNPETMNGAVSTVIISLDRHFANDAGAWGDIRPVLIAGSQEWDQVLAAIQKHGPGTVDRVMAKARVTPIDEEYLRQIEKQSGPEGG